MIDVKILIEHTKELNVLYVEDDVSLLESAGDLLKFLFKDVEMACNGQEGLDKYLSYYKENDLYYDLVMTDINMPLMNGIDMSSKILKVNSIQPIIITSAHNEAEYLFKAIDVGVNGFVAKPLINEKLFNVLYKVSMSINDHKYVEEYYTKIEEFSLKLESQNKELMRQNAELIKSSRLLDTMVHKEQFDSAKKKYNEENLVDVSVFQEQVQRLRDDDLDELKELHDEIDVVIIYIINNITNGVESSSILELYTKTLKYASILSYYSVFTDLSSSMSQFANTMQNDSLPENVETIRNIFILFERFMFILYKWKNDLSYDNKKNINNLHNSMTNDIKTIRNMWLQKD